MRSSSRDRGLSIWPARQIMLKYPAMDAADASLVSLAEMSPKAALVPTDDAISSTAADCAIAP